MLNKVINLVIDLVTYIQTYKWRNDKNTLPFDWKCQRCGTITTIRETDTSKTYKCSNEDCPIKLKFVLQVL